MVGMDLKMNDVDYDLPLCTQVRTESLAEAR